MGHCVNALEALKNGGAPVIPAAAVRRTNLTVGGGVSNISAARRRGLVFGGLMFLYITVPYI